MLQRKDASIMSQWAFKKQMFDILLLRKKNLCNSKTIIELLANDKSDQRDSLGTWVPDSETRNIPMTYKGILLLDDMDSEEIDTSLEQCREKPRDASIVAPLFPSIQAVKFCIHEKVSGQLNSYFSDAVYSEFYFMKADVIIKHIEDKTDMRPCFELFTEDFDICLDNLMLNWNQFTAKFTPTITMKFKVFRTLKFCIKSVRQLDPGDALKLFIRKMLSISPGSSDAEQPRSQLRGI